MTNINGKEKKTKELKMHAFMSLYGNHMEDI